MTDAEQRLAALDAAIASGLLRVTIGGKTQEYRSLDDMQRIRNALAAEAGVTPAAPTRTFAAFRRGT